MIDWHSSMQQSYEYYIVDPHTWKDITPITDVESCTINRDEDDETLGSATIDCSSLLDECYVRSYLVAIQNGVSYKYPLGTFMVQTPSVDYNGKRKEISMDAYTPLIELKETLPPLGYALLKGQEIMSIAYSLCRENMRGPVIQAKSLEKLYDDFVAEPDESWLQFLKALVANAKFKFSLDEMGRLLFEPISDMGSLQPVWTYTDDNSSILYPDIKNERDLYGVPNVVEVIYSSDNLHLFSRVVNDSPTSPISTVNRGREIVHRETSPEISGNPTQEYLDSYAEQLLRNLSCLEHKIVYSHGYCPVRVGDCVLLNCTNADLNYVKAKVVSQSIKCETGCPVEETAVYTEKLWR